MSDDKQQKQQEILKEQYEERVRQERLKEQANYQPETDETDEKDPPVGDGK